jgi:hypothetical protein
MSQRQVQALSLRIYCTNMVVIIAMTSTVFDVELDAMFEAMIISKLLDI